MALIEVIKIFCVQVHVFFALLICGDAKREGTLPSQFLRLRRGVIRSAGVSKSLF